MPSHHGSVAAIPVERWLRPPGRRTEPPRYARSEPERGIALGNTVGLPFERHNAACRGLPDDGAGATAKTTPTPVAARRHLTMGPRQTHDCRDRPRAAQAIGLCGTLDYEKPAAINSQQGSTIIGFSWDEGGEWRADDHELDWICESVERGGRSSPRPSNRRAEEGGLRAGVRGPDVGCQSRATGARHLS